MNERSEVGGLVSIMDVVRAAYTGSSGSLRLRTFTSDISVASHPVVHVLAASLGRAS